MQIVVAPASRASLVAVTVSWVEPECEIVIATMSGPVSEALIAWTCESTTTLDSTPMRRQPVIGVLGDRSGAADAVELDAARLADRGDRVLHRALVEHLHRVVQRLQIAAEDLLDHRPGVVGARQILVDELHRLHQIARQRDLDLLEAARTEQAAERDHAAFARFRPFGHLRHRHVHDLGRMGEEDVGNARSRRRQRRAQRR